MIQPPFKIPNRPRLAATGPHLLNADRYANHTLVPWHEHPGTELVLVTEGRCEIELGGSQRSAQATAVPAAALSATDNTLFVLPARVPQLQRTFEFTRTTYAIFSLAGFAFDESPRVLNIAAAPEIARWLEDLCGLFRILVPDTSTGGPSMPPASSGLPPAASRAHPAHVTRAILTAILERIKLLEQERETATTLHPGLTRALEFLRRNTVKTLTLAEVAHAAQVSESHLRALFRARFGHGPMQHQQHLRMELARKLLPHPYLRIQEVARECGYADAKYFSRLFTRATGHPPRAWRANPRLNEV